MTARRSRVIAYGLCVFTAFLVWNGIFGLLVSRGEKQYLLDQARHELGLGPEASLPARMDGTIHDGVREATRWAIVVFALGAVAVRIGSRSPAPEEDGPAGRRGVTLDER